MLERGPGVLTDQRQERDLGGRRIQTALPGGIEDGPEPITDGDVRHRERAPGSDHVPCRTLGVGHGCPALEISKRLGAKLVIGAVIDAHREKLGVLGREHRASPRRVAHDKADGRNERCDNGLWPVIDGDDACLLGEGRDLAIPLVERRRKLFIGGSRGLAA